MGKKGVKKRKGFVKKPLKYVEGGCGGCEDVHPAPTGKGGMNSYPIIIKKV
ncbi:MAG: hypothetical protein HFI30_05495 [Lachnospiraceae bacterium]|jgi:hypothetical protein|nr:hypothetical protein [Lachnospiraceae bacterium]